MKRFLFMTAPRRRGVAWLALFALLFAQCALAAYACPARAPLGIERASGGAASTTAHCGEHAPAAVPATNACATHCQDGTLAASGFDIPQFATVAILVVAWRHPDADAAGQAVLARAELPTPPPVTDRFCRLLI